MNFVKANRTGIWLRAAIVGPTGSGKTMTAMQIASGLCPRFAVIDTERASARRYADVFDFDTLELQSFAPERFIEALDAAAKAGYRCVVVDSLSHAWSGKDGVLEFVDRKAGGGNNFAAWRFATPLHNKMVDALLSFPGHLIVTMRSKMEYVQEKDERGKTIIRKVGMQSIQRDGMEYEFDFVADMDSEHVLRVSKFRGGVGEWAKMADAVIDKPGRTLGEALGRWCGGDPPRAAAKRPDAASEPEPSTEPPPDDLGREFDEAVPGAAPEAAPKPEHIAELGEMLGELEYLQGKRAEEIAWPPDKVRKVLYARIAEWSRTNSTKLTLKEAMDRALIRTGEMIAGLKASKAASEEW